MAKKSKRIKTLKKNTNFSRKHFTIYMLIFAAVGAFTLWVSFAAPHNGGHTKSYLYTMTITPAEPYSFGESVYTTTTAPQVPQSYMGLSCTQNGAVVASGTHANWPGGWYYNWEWKLGPTLSWGSGAADCTVFAFHLSNNKNITDAATTFHVNP